MITLNDSDVQETIKDGQRDDINRHVKFGLFGL
jgi:hypothetical protein